METISDIDFSKLLKSFVNSEKRNEKTLQAIFVACVKDLLCSSSVKRLNLAYSAIKTTEYTKQFMLAIRCECGEFSQNSIGKFYHNGKQIIAYDRKRACFSIVGDLPELPEKIAHFRSFLKGNSEQIKPLLTWNEFSSDLKKSLEKKVTKGLVKPTDIKKFQELLDYIS